jgi:fructose-1,6-bisphosphatase/inositol monophosphatase family enzyme
MQEMLAAVFQVGKFARDSQGTVENDEKDHPLSLETDPEFVKRRDRAKTVIDEKSQEMLLTALEQITQHPMRIDAEEDTPQRETLHTESAAETLVIDPIDGTLEYFEGGNAWSVNVALVGNGKVVFAIMYFPVQEILYLLDTDGKPYKCVCKGGTVVDREIITPTPNTSAKKVYCNNRVPEDAIEKLSKDFTVVRDIHGVVKWPDALLGCISGEYRAALFVRPQVRDILIGAMIEAMPGGYVTDFKGRKVKWPDGGRIPEAAFGFGKLPAKVTLSLK